MSAIRETRVKCETCCHVFYIVYRKFLTATNTSNAITNNAIAMSNSARFIATYHLSRDLGSGSHVLGDRSVTLRGGYNAWGDGSRLKGAGSQNRLTLTPAYTRSVQTLMKFHSRVIKIHSLTSISALIIQCRIHGGRGVRPPYFWQKQFNFLHCIQCLKKIIFKIEFGFYSGRNPRSFWKCGGVCACVWIEIVAATVFCSAKAQFWMIYEAILIPKIYARLQEIASNFSKLDAISNISLRRSVRGFAPLPAPPFQNSGIRPCNQLISYSTRVNLGALVETTEMSNSKTAFRSTKWRSKWNRPSRWNAR